MRPRSQASTGSSQPKEGARTGSQRGRLAAMIVLGALAIAPATGFAACAHTTAAPKSSADELRALAQRLEHAGELTYTAEYDAGGVVVTHTQDPPRQAYQGPGTTLILGPDTVMLCRTTAGAAGIAPARAAAAPPAAGAGGGAGGRPITAAHATANAAAGSSHSGQPTRPAQSRAASAAATPHTTQAPMHAAATHAPGASAAAAHAPGASAAAAHASGAPELAAPPLAAAQTTAPTPTCQRAPGMDGITLPQAHAVSPTIGAQQFVAPEVVTALLLRAAARPGLTVASTRVSIADTPIDCVAVRTSAGTAPRTGTTDPGGRTSGTGLASGTVLPSPVAPDTELPPLRFTTCATASGVLARFDGTTDSGVDGRMFLRQLASTAAAAAFDAPPGASMSDAAGQ